MARPIVTLTTDYGTSDHLVGAMKGVMLGINPDINLVDITHNVIAHDILDGALAIGNAYKCFPSKTVHLVVVDPGVGTARRPVLVSADTQYFVAPDNGVLSAIYDQAESLTVWNIISEHYFRQPISHTFHGRDVFAPVAAWLTKSWQTSAFGEEITDFVRFGVPKPKSSGSTIKGSVLQTDRFGNLITNITSKEVPALEHPGGNVVIHVGNGQVGKLVQTFAEGPAGEAVALIGSSGFLEICMNKGDASRKSRRGRGAEVTVEVA